MSIYVFVGPTISADEARNWLDAVYLPPVSQGDISSLLRKQPKIIGIIDGYFEHVPSVWHKEILLALSKGVHVVGGASMGALRAAELYPYGMIGIGEIFQWYRDGEIEADDEVAIRHASEEYNYKALSEALVNVRQNFRLAHEQAIISRSTWEKLIAIGKQLNYSERSYQGILGQGIEVGLPEKELADMKEFLASRAVEQKKLDAIKVLEYISDLAKNSLPLEATFELQFTARLDDLMDRDTPMDVTDEFRLTPEVIVDYADQERDDFRQIADRAAANRLILDFAKHLGVIISDAELQEGASGFRESIGLDTDEEIADWFRRNHVTAEEVNQLIGQWLLVRKMKTVFGPDNRDLIRQLRWEGKYEEIVATMVARGNDVEKGVAPKLDSGLAVSLTDNVDDAEQ